MPLHRCTGAIWDTILPDERVYAEWYQCSNLTVFIANSVSYLKNSKLYSFQFK